MIYISLLFNLVISMGNILRAVNMKRISSRAACAGEPGVATTMATSSPK